MKYQELLKQCDWNEIWSQLVLNYEDQSNLHDTYHRIYKKLCIVDGVKSDMRIILTRVNEDDGTTWIDVSGKNGTTYRDSDEYKDMNWDDSLMDREIKYGLDFTDWQQWIEMEIDSEALNDFTMPEIAAHCLWEMTFISFDEEEMYDTKEMIYKTVEDIKNGTVEVIPLDLEESEE